MSSLARGVYAITRTKRRRLLWCAWWTGEPQAAPFRAPDAWGGGARDEDEAKAMAESVAGRPLTCIEGRWAGAWVRVRAGLAPFPSRAPRDVATCPPSPASPYRVLGVAEGASLDEVKAAFREQALAHHPDHGGTAEGFIAVKRAYDAAVARIERGGPRRRRRR